MTTKLLRQSIAVVFILQATSNSLLSWRKLRLAINEFVDLLPHGFKSVLPKCARKLYAT